MTALADATDPRFTGAQSAHLARFEAAVAPPEVTEAARIEEVARAIQVSLGYHRIVVRDSEANTAAAAAVAAYRAAQDGEAEEAVRGALRVHHPIMRSETGPFSGCRCGQVKLGQDVIGHVTDHLRAALDPQAGEHRHVCGAICALRSEPTR